MHIEQTITTVFSPQIYDTVVAVKWICDGNPPHDRQLFDKVTKFSLILLNAVEETSFFQGFWTLFKI